MGGNGRKRENVKYGVFKELLEEWIVFILGAIFGAIWFAHYLGLIGGGSNG